MARFFTGAILETLQWWLTHKKPISQESIEKTNHGYDESRLSVGKCELK